MSKLTVSELNGISTSLNQVDIPAGHQLKIDGNLAFDHTGAHTLPSGNTAARPASPPMGAMRFNTDISSFEIYIGSWEIVGGGGNAASALGSFGNPAQNGIDLKESGAGDGYYWIRPIGHTTPRYCYVDNTNYDGGWVLVKTIGSNTTNHWSTFESNNLYSATIDGQAANYVPYSGTGYSTTDGRRHDDNFIRDLGSFANGGGEIINIRIAQNGAAPLGGPYDTYAGGTNANWRYASFIRMNNGIHYFSSLNTGGDGRQGDRREGTFSVSHVYPYNWERPGGHDHIRVYDDRYKVFDYHSNPSNIQTSRYGVNRVLYGYTGANSGRGIYGGSASFTGSNNLNPGYMFIR